MNEKLQRYSNFPRGKVLFAPFKRVFKEIGREFVNFFLLAILCVIAGSFAEISEKVVSFETGLFWLCVGLNVLQIILSILFFKKIHGWKKWIIIFFGIVMIGYIFAMLKRLL